MKKTILPRFAIAVVILSISAVSSWAKSGQDARCQAHRLDAVALYAKKVFYCWAHALKTGSTEPQGLCIAEAYGQLDTRWNSADTQGTGCNSAAELEDILALVGGDGTHEGAVDAVLSGSLGGEDGVTGNEDDMDLEDLNARTLADELLKASGQKAFELLMAYAQDVHRPKPSKLGSKISKAQAKFMKQTAKAIDRAKRKGVEYGGATAQDLEDIIDSMVQAVVDAVTASPGET